MCCWVSWRRRWDTSDRWDEWVDPNPIYRALHMSPSFRLLTGNLLGQRCDPDALGEILDRLRPDVVLTQEMGPDSARVIADRYPSHDLHPSLEYEGRGVASHLPMQCGSLDLPWRAGTWAWVDVEGRQVLLAGVHMPNPITLPWWRSVRERGEQFDALSKWVEKTVGEGSALAIAGDMNASPAWPLYHRLAANWDDLVLDGAERNERRPEPTWAWRPGWPRVLRIDHVFGRGLIASGVQVVTIGGSDHAAVVVDLTLTE
jgi:endonuclease/exonuclease/phosphatase (EEP) superfamily protein YafD